MNHDNCYRVLISDPHDAVWGPIITAPDEDGARIKAQEMYPSATILRVQHLHSYGEDHLMHPRVTTSLLHQALNRRATD
jgi:hypothetical protein